jgi:hypothetical protein
MHSCYRRAAPPQKQEEEEEEEERANQRNEIGVFGIDGRNGMVTKVQK